MSPQNGVKVIGAARLRATMRKAGIDLADLKAANASVGAIVAAAAHAKAPRGRTGRLAGSVRSSGTNTKAIVRAGKALVPYAGPIHWGWPRRHITAQPFLSDAATATEGIWFKEYSAAVNRIVGTIEGK